MRDGELELLVAGATWRGSTSQVRAVDAAVTADTHQGPTARVLDRRCAARGERRMLMDVTSPRASRARPDLVGGSRNKVQIEVYFRTWAPPGPSLQRQVL